MLSKKQLEDIRDCKKIECDLCSFFALCTGAGAYSTAAKMSETALELLDKTESQQLEIERVTKLLSIDAMENKQLKAQNEVMRENAQRFIDLYEASPCDFIGKVPSLMDLHHKYYCIFNDILHTEPIEYHNPVDMAALQKAREVFTYLNACGGLGSDKHRYIDSALEAIEAIGGGQ